MRCTAEVLTDRHMDNDEGEWFEPYTLTVSTDVTEGPDEYTFGDCIEVDATDNNGDLESWRWEHLTSREQTEAEAGLIASYQRQASGLPRCPHCRNVLPVVAP